MSHREQRLTQRSSAASAWGSGGGSPGGCSGSPETKAPCSLQMRGGPGRQTAGAPPPPHQRPPAHRPPARGPGRTVTGSGDRAGKHGVGALPDEGDGVSLQLSWGFNYMVKLQLPPLETNCTFRLIVFRGSHTGSLLLSGGGIGLRALPFLGTGGLLILQLSGGGAGGQLLVGSPGGSAWSKVRLVSPGDSEFLLYFSVGKTRKL